MALPMARPILISGTYYLKQRVSADLVHVVGRPQVKVSLRTKAPAEAKKRHAVQMSANQAHWDLLRRGSTNLDDRQADAVAGEVYRALLKTVPGGSRNALVQMSYANIRWTLEMALGLAPPPPGGRVEKWTALEGVLGSYVDAAIAGHCVLDERTRHRVLEKAAVAAIQATKQTLRECEGDWRVDPMADRFPSSDVLEKPAAVRVDVETLWRQVEKGCGLKTRLKYRRVLDDMMAFLGTKDIGSVTRENVKSWRDDLVKRPSLAARTVQRDYLGTIKAVLACGMRNDLLGTNVAGGVLVEEARLAKRRQMRGFSDEEATIILTASLQPSTARTSRKFASAKRWVPWLCGYTGARVNEITQLRSRDVVVRDGHWCVAITPETGSVKNGRPHDVPLHEHLLGQGFLEFVDQHGREEPLFYNPRKSSEARGTLPSETTGKALARWVRALGIVDTSVDPNHGWRHKFKTDGRTVGINPNALDALQGHTIAGMNGRYGDFPARVTAPEIAKIPRFKIAGFVDSS